MKTELKNLMCICFRPSFWMALGILCVSGFTMPAAAQDDTADAVATDAVETSEEQASENGKEPDVSDSNADEAVEVPETVALKQQSWVFQPYDVRIWLAIEDSPRLASIDRNMLYAEIKQLIQGWVPYGWRTTISEPPQEILADAINNARDLSMQDITLLYEPPKEDPNVVKIKEEAETATDDAESVQAEDEDAVTADSEESTEDAEVEVDPFAYLIKPNLLKQADKLYVVSIRDNGRDIVLEAVGFDCNGRVRVEDAVRELRNVADTAHNCFDAIKEIFRPVAKITFNAVTDGKQAGLELRSAGLVNPELNPDSPLIIGNDSVFRPVVRRNDREGFPLIGGIIEVVWTYIYVQQTKPYGVLEGEMISTFSSIRNPVGSRPNSRTEKYGLLVPVRHENTLLKIAANDLEDYQLEGYNVFVRNAKSSIDADDNPIDPVGQTDWRGAIPIEIGPTTLRIIYVKNGERVLARLPFVPGAFEEIDAFLPNDDVRLEYEAFFAGIMNSILDITVQRKVLETRINIKIKNGEITDAEKIFKEELMSLRSRKDIEDVLNEKENQKINNKRLNGTVLRKIDDMFARTTGLIKTYLSEDIRSTVEKAIKDAGGLQQE
ncbi:MAG: hypothetical protein MK329_10390 [Pirellulales bacterium]|nr:hypothetical protein [Pirellulales bacterium]